jgi:hypothetical protein
MNPWAVLESLRALAAIPAVWRSRLGDSFEAFSAAFLERTSVSATSFPCPRGCGCAHEIIHPRPAQIIAVCRCESWCCEDLILSPNDISIWRLNWGRLGNALCRALELQFRMVDLTLYNTRQIGAWTANGIPAILTVQHTSTQFRQVLTTLIARLRQPFILLAPTADHLDARANELLTGVGAAFFSLEAQVRFTNSGPVSAITPPGRLFARFTAAPTQANPEEDARRALALLQRLDSDQLVKPPSVLTVFRLYCIEELSAAQIARKCHSSKATVVRRLELIREKTGLDPKQLRQFSSHLDKSKMISRNPALRISTAAGSSTTRKTKRIARSRRREEADSPKPLLPVFRLLTSAATLRKDLLSSAADSSPAVRSHP